MLTLNVVFVRCLSVWERQTCSLHSVGAATEAVGVALCWQPNGRHIYVSSAADGNPRLKLYEKNGLEHGSFDIYGKGTIFGT